MCGQILSIRYSWTHPSKIMSDPAPWPKYNYLCRINECGPAWIDGDPLHQIVTADIKLLGDLEWAKKVWISQGSCNPYRFKFERSGETRGESDDMCCRAIVLGFSGGEKVFSWY